MALFSGKFLELLLKTISQDKNNIKIESFKTYIKNVVYNGLFKTRIPPVVHAYSTRIPPVFHAYSTRIPPVVHALCRY